MHGARADTHSDANLPDGPADRDARAEPDRPAADSNPRPAYVDAYAVTVANTSAGPRARLGHRGSGREPA